MRWFFLPFIFLLALAGNAAIFSEATPMRLFGGVAFNVFVLSLGFTWWHAYFASGEARARGLVVAHALLTLSLSAAFVLAGSAALLSDSCESLHSTRRHGVVDLIGLAQTHGHCRTLGGVALALGFWLAHPAMRLFIALRR